MRRIQVPQRQNYVERLLDDGFVYYRDQLPSGEQQDYWVEGACYQFSEDEYQNLHKAAAQLHRMYKQALDFVIRENRWGDLGIHNPQMIEAIQLSWQEGHLDLCGRFDFAFNGGVGAPKLLEYNCDSAGMFIETKAADSWYKDLQYAQVWQEDTYQWNRLESLLAARWQRIASVVGTKRMHFMWVEASQSPENFMNTAYMQSLALEAGLANNHSPLEEMVWTQGQGYLDAQGQKIQSAWKAYHWEWLAMEDPGILKTISDHNNPYHIHWIEPIWKAALSSKGMLAILWELFPQSPLLLPAYVGAPGELEQYACKPLFGAESQQVQIVSQEGTYQDADSQQLPWGNVYQQYYSIKQHDGQRPVTSVWMVGGQPAAILLRESQQLATDFYARTIPHVIKD